MAEQGWWSQMMGWIGLRAAEQEQREQEQVLQGMGFAAPLRERQPYQQEPWEGEMAMDVNRVSAHVVSGEGRTGGEAEHALQGLYDRTRDRVDGWVAEVERQWDAQHATEAQWQQAWRNDWGMEGVSYDPNNAEHRDMREGWETERGVWRTSYVLDQAETRGILSHEERDGFRDARESHVERTPPTLGEYVAQNQVEWIREEQREAARERVSEGRQEGRGHGAEETPSGLENVYEQEKARVDGWVANAEREWDAVHRTEAQWQEAWRSDYAMKDTPYDPDKAVHRDLYDTWQLSLDAQRERAVLTQAKEEGIVSPEAIHTYEQEQTPFTPTLGHYQGMVAEADAMRPTLTDVYDQEKARVDGWIANAEREWDAVHRTEAQWQEAWSSDYDMKDTPYDPDNAGHQEKRDLWESEQDFRRDIAVTARAEDEGIVSRDTVDLFYTEAAEYAGASAIGDAPFPGTLGHYAGREAAEEASQYEQNESEGMEM